MLVGDEDDDMIIGLDHHIVMRHQDLRIARDRGHIVGVVEIAGGIVVLVTPRFGGLLVAAWLGGIIISLPLVGGYGEIALRDFGLLAGALALSRPASAHAARDKFAQSL